MRSPSTKVLLALGLATGLWTTAFSAGAQPAKPAEQKPAAAPAPAPVGVEPQTTTASFGDWVLRCQRTGTDKEATRICEVDQTIQVQGQAAPIAQIGFVRMQKNEAPRLTLALPVNVSFPSSPKIATDGKEPIELAWRRCVPAGCIAEATLRDETVRQLKALQGAGKIESKDAGGHDFSLGLSFRGLSQAMDALAKEP
ncbi:invasion associated locus B family protein [Rhodoblastus sp.]|uniref:invasion associated locus B family protein n=1 Tax=Rhodoblastus sp. TaxID=1962975 RepID=UPI00262D318F|nr:invasion associated locus B family protein [Rhodoblastus sp.]